MKTFTASRIADGQGLFPCKIIVGANKITVRIPGLFRNQDKDIPFNKIADISVDTPLLGYSTITFNTIGFDFVKAHGFTKSEVKEIKSLIENPSIQHSNYKSSDIKISESYELDSTDEISYSSNVIEDEWDNLRPSPDEFEDDLDYFRPPPEAYKDEKRHVTKSQISFTEKFLDEQEDALYKEFNEQREEKRKAALFKVKKDFLEILKEINNEKNSLIRIRSLVTAEKSYISQLELLSETHEVEGRKKKLKENQELLISLENSFIQKMDEEKSSLKKNTISILKNKNGLQNVSIELIWDKAISENQDIDLDLSIFMLDADGKLPESEFLVFYNNLESPDGALIHSGETKSNNESLKIDLSRIDKRVEFLYISVTINKAEINGHHFGLSQNAFFRIRNVKDNSKILEYNITKSFDGFDSVLIASISRNNGSWLTEDLGREFGGGIPALIELYSV